MKTLIISIVIATVAAADGAGLTLDEAIDRALAENPEVASYWEAWKAAEAEHTVVTSLPDPMLEITLGRSGADADGSMRMLGVSQRIPFPTKITTARSRSEMLGAASEARYHAGALQVVKQVKDAYVEAVLIDASISILQADRADLRVLQDALARKYEVGRASQHDVVKAHLEDLLLGNRIEVLRSDRLASAVASLKSLLNMDPARDPGDLARPHVPIEDIEPRDLIGSNADAAPEVDMWSYRAAAAQRDLTLARMQWIPDLSLKVFREEMDMGMGHNKAQGVMVAVNLPIWAWRNKAMVGAKRSLLAMARHQLEVSQDKTDLALEQALAAFEASRESYRLFETSIIPEAELAYESALTAYETGRLDLPGLLAAQHTLREARLQHLELWAKLARELARIENIKGTRFY